MQDGPGSKKFLFSIGVCLLAFIYTLLAATKLPELKGLIDAFTGLLEFVTGAYLTGNIANKFVAGREERLAAKAAPAKPDPLDKDIPSH